MLEAGRKQPSVCLIRKPHPAVYYYALANAGMDAAETCYVGDNLNWEIVGAKAAGFSMTVCVQYLLYHLAGLLYGDFSNSLIEGLKNGAWFPPISKAFSGTRRAAQCTSMTGLISCNTSLIWTFCKQMLQRRRSSPA